MRLFKDHPLLVIQIINKSYVHFKNLPKLVSKVDKIEKELNAQNLNDE